MDEWSLKEYRIGGLGALCDILSAAVAVGCFDDVALLM
jgi:hypothetical protein